MTTGERVKRRRQELQLTVEDLALKLNKNRATVYRYESGDIENMPLTVLEPLAAALETTPAELMGWGEQKETAPSQKAESGELSIDEEIDQLLYNLKDTSSATLMLDGKPASTEAIAALRSALTTGVTMARQMEKEKEDNE